MTCTVQEGECVLSLAASAGLYWETVWNHPENSALRALREHPNALKAGDRLFVPDRAFRQEERGVEACHRFCALGVPARLRLRLRVRGQVLASTDFILTVDGHRITGQTDDGGNLDVSILPDAAEAKLRLRGDAGEYTLKLGWLDPVTETKGIQARLTNLGYSTRGIDGDFGKNSRSAMQTLQKDLKMAKTALPDEVLRTRLVQEYGC